MLSQADELIDNDKLAEDFLTMYDKLGLLYTEEERKVLNQRNRPIGGGNPRHLPRSLSPCLGGLRIRS